jgi:AAA+ ATPase superfamily predicted ATPase
MNIDPVFIGRKDERRILEQTLYSNQAEMVSVIGRRRVGKTFLIQSVFKDKIDFELTGIQHSTSKEQLQNFAFQLARQSGDDALIEIPSNWLDAFFKLTLFLEKKIKTGKKVVFFDELPWLSSKRSGFLKGLSWFWNSWAVKQPIVLIICGSAASWMIQKVLNDKGGLHNRITKRINLEPFDLRETEEFLHTITPNLERYQILQLYMAMGGIPHYLKEIKPGKSAAQIIDEICFSKTGLLKDEFTLLYPALFDQPEDHIITIRALAERPMGLSRKEIVSTTGLSEGGATSKVIEELVQSGFISLYYTFGKKKKERRYRLTDEYSLFYLKFIEKNRTEGAGTWQKLSQTQTWKSWSGYAFESIALKHISQIKKALSIGGVYTETSVFYFQGNEEIPGVQIDLLIDRNDQVINLFEVKFYRENVLISKPYADDLRIKIAAFRAATKTKKQIFLNLLSAFPLTPNKHSIGLIDEALTMDPLFEF